ncbi:hypothetical protein [Pelistega europaea]|uniref:Uncharacterized protein n=1 Tax=Pelistega europaea TaxID=106147 RepID=A0A7Y4L950_9BURK|nr:hypothetical protein [Pelistega europaea]NOL49262.1 hypothetical protein [Pelistega europaea]
MDTFVNILKFLGNAIFMILRFLFTALKAMFSELKEAQDSLSYKSDEDLEKIASGRQSAKPLEKMMARGMLKKRQGEE